MPALKNASYPANQPTAKSLMPYFIYKTLSKKNIEYVDVFDGYQDAKKFVREQRAAMPADADWQLKMMHAGNKAQAETLLTAEREERPLGEDA